LNAQIVNVLSHFIPFEREVRVRSGESYMLRAVPYRTSDNRVEGAVITFMRVPPGLEAKRDDATAEFMLVLDPELHIKAASPSFYRKFRLTPESVRDRPLSLVNHVISDNPELRKALEKAQKTTDTIAPFGVELKLDGTRQKLECRIERISLDGGGLAITVSMHPPAIEAATPQTAV
jgi:hypothetical protein